MLSKRRRLLLHALLASGIGLLGWLQLQLSSGGATGWLIVAAAIGSFLVAAGFVVRFFSVLSEPERAIPAEPAPGSPAVPRHWTENAVIIWVGLCIAALTAEAVRGGFADSDRLVSVVTCLLLMGLMAMQGVRLVKAERRSPSGTR